MQKIVIASIAKDIGETFHLDYKRIIQAFSDFEIVKWIIIESNSTDNSIAILNEYSKNSNIIKFESLSSHGSESLLRSQKMGNARNKYLELFNKINEKNDIAYLVVCDLNNLNCELEKAAVKSCWESNEWAAVTANQSGPYYDVWTVRHPIWLPYDPWEKYEELQIPLGSSVQALWDFVYSKMINIPINTPWIKVDSAFGGFAIYKTQYIFGCEYIGITSKGTTVCEHVSFNQGIVNNGGLIYINPNFINFKLTDHSLDMLGMLT